LDDSLTIADASPIPRWRAVAVGAKLWATLEILAVRVYNLLWYLDILASVTPAGGSRITQESGSDDSLPG